MTDEDTPAPNAAEALTPGMRDRFHIPNAPDGTPAIYLAGQSLGLQPRTAAAASPAMYAKKMHRTPNTPRTKSTGTGIAL